MTTYVHSGVSIALQAGSGPLNMPGRKKQWPVCVMFPVSQSANYFVTEVTAE